MLTLALFGASLAAALWIYTSGQHHFQDRLVNTYKAALFETAFCDDVVAFDRELCEKADGLSWQQVRLLLDASGVIDASEIETADDLGEIEDDNPAFGLVESLTPDDRDLPPTSLGLLYYLAQKQCVEEAACNNPPSEPADLGSEESESDSNTVLASPYELAANTSTQPAAGHVIALGRTAQTGPGRTLAPTGAPTQEQTCEERRAENFQRDLSHALADSVGGADFAVSVDSESDPESDPEPDSLRAFLDALGEIEWTNTARQGSDLLRDLSEALDGPDILDALGEIEWTAAARQGSNLLRDLFDALGELDLRDAPSELEWTGRCETARAELANMGGEKSAHSVSGWRFSTARCLTDDVILTRLLALHRTVANSDDGQEVGYNLKRACGGGLNIERQEAFTRSMQYVLGVTHATREVRAARKWADMARGPEHVGILALGLFALSMLGARHAMLRARLLRARWQGWRGGARAGPLARLVGDLADGGQRAERRLDALARSRVLARWSITAIPALGFIGTVRGILEALAQAGDVVWAANRPERADAVGQLAGALGLAFSTTLFALLVGVVLGLLSVHAARA